METRQEKREYILGKAFRFGSTALIDPVPELWDELSIASRAETMGFYFRGLIDTLEKEYEGLAMEEVGPELEEEIVNAMEKGFEALMDRQPGYHAVAYDHVAPEVKDEIMAAMEKIFEALVEERLKVQESRPKDIWIEEGDAIKFVKGVFETLKHHHVR